MFTNHDNNDYRNNGNELTVSNFIDQIVTKNRTIDTSNTNYTVLISCDNASSLLSMQWASLITADGCMRNILTSVSNQCDGESSCNYNYSGGYQSFDAECSDTFDVEIGAYCM